MKKITAILLMVITSINIIGCTTDKITSSKLDECVDLLASKNDDNLANATNDDVEKAISDNFEDSNNSKDITKATKDFLDIDSKVSKYFEDGYDGDNPSAFRKNDDQVTMRYVRTAKEDLDNTNKYLNMFFGKLIFNNEKDYEYIETLYRLVLCDEEDLQKMQIDSDAEQILKTINPDVSIKDIQAAIDKNIKEIGDNIIGSGTQEVIYDKDGKKCTVIAYKLSTKPILVLIDFSEDIDK